MKNNLKYFTKQHRENISKACKGRISWNKGIKQNRQHILKNMQTHLKYDVSFEWLDSFEDIEKLKYLNRTLSRKRDCEGFTTEIYKKFIERFYNDRDFNFLFDEWIKTKDKWIKPSLDHIQAKCKGGTLLLDNLQFISWLENRAKIDISQTEWNKIKQNIYYYLSTQIEENLRISAGSAQPNLSTEQIKNLELPFPPIEEQKRIVKKLDELSEQTKKLELIYKRKLEDLEELKKSILQKAFNGEL